MYVMCVTGSLPILLILRATKGASIIMDNTQCIVLCAKKDSHLDLIWKNMFEYTLKTNHLNAVSVVKCLLISPH